MMVVPWAWGERQSQWQHCRQPQRPQISSGYSALWQKFVSTSWNGLLRYDERHIGKAINSQDAFQKSSSRTKQRPRQPITVLHVIFGHLSPDVTVVAIVSSRLWWEALAAIN
jgi:hypothetical protein